MISLTRSELKQRIRGKRWWIVLVLWTAVLLLVVALVRETALTQASFERQFTGNDFIQIGPAMFGTLVLFVLGLMALIVPALSSSSINGERERGTLALLQSTLYRSHEIALAKFLSAFLTALAFIAASIPLALWSMSEGGVPVVRAAVVYVVLAASAALFVAVGLAASAMIRRPGLATLTAYLSVFVLTAGMPILFGVSLLSAPTESIERNFAEGETYTETRTVIGWRWMLLAPDPFVVLADTAPRQTSRFVSDPLEVLRQAVRSSRTQDAPPGSETGSQFPESAPLFSDHGFEPPPEPPPLWPTGLLIDLVLVSLCAYEVLRKLQVPARTLATGERVA